MTALATVTDDTLEGVSSLPWDEFLARFVGAWRQGEHVSIVGATGSGKSVLALELLEARTAASERWSSAVLANKPRDRELTKLTRRGWVKLRKWPPRHGERRILLWPGMRSVESFDTQAQVFDHALRELFLAGRWAIYLDEVRYVSHTLGLGRLLELFWLQGRSSGLTVVAGTQRSAWVPLEFYSQATHLLLFREASPANRKRLTEHCGGADGTRVARVVSRLDTHEFLHVNTRTGSMVRSRVNLTGSKTP